MSFKEEVLELLINKITELQGAAGVTSATRFKEDLNCKSSDIVRITAVLEEEYDVEVPFMAFNRCATLEYAADYMCKLMGMV